MKLQIAAILLVLCVGTTFAAEPLGVWCGNRVGHLIDRIFHAQDSNLNLEEYRAMYAYVEDRLLHNRTYTQCYLYNKQFCQVATTNILPKLLHFAKNNATTVTDARKDYNYVKHVASYFLNKCGLNLNPTAEALHKEDLARATCKNTATRIYNYLRSMNVTNLAELTKMNKLEKDLVFKTLYAQFATAQQKGCINQMAHVPRIALESIVSYVTLNSTTEALLADFLAFSSYLGTEYLRGSAINKNITRICELEVQAARDYLTKSDGFTHWKSFSEQFNSLFYQTNCFQRSTRCKVFRTRLAEGFLNNSLVPTTAEQFNSWWSIIRFNFRQFIYDCYSGNKGKDARNAIWSASYKYENPECTQKVGDIVANLRGNFFYNAKPTVAYPALQYIRNDLNEISRICFSLDENCTNYKAYTNFLVDRVLRIDAPENLDLKLPAWYLNQPSNVYLIQLNALKWIHHCTKKPTEVVVPKEIQGCSNYAAEIRRVLEDASRMSLFEEALSTLRTQKKLVEQYKDCNTDAGASKLCIDLSEQVRSQYIRLLFTNEPAEFRQKVLVLVDSLADVSDECKPLRSN